MQALTDLLLLPPPITAFVQQQVGAFHAPLAITTVEPGHCLWQVRKASATLPAAPSALTAGSGTVTSSLPEYASSTNLCAAISMFCFEPLLREGHVRSIPNALLVGHVDVYMLYACGIGRPAIHRIKCDRSDALLRVQWASCEVGNSSSVARQPR